MSALCLAHARACGSFSIAKTLFHLPEPANAMALPPTPAKQSIMNFLSGWAAFDMCCAIFLGDFQSLVFGGGDRSSLRCNRLWRNAKPCGLSHPYTFIVFRKDTISLVIIPAHIDGYWDCGPKTELEVLLNIPWHVPQICVMLTAIRDAARCNFLCLNFARHNHFKSPNKSSGDSVLRTKTENTFGERRCIEVRRISRFYTSSSSCVRLDKVAGIWRAFLISGLLWLSTDKTLMGNNTNH